MLSRTYKFSLLALSALALCFCGVTKARAQDYELRCRGGEKAFAIDRLDAKTLSLNFSASPRAAAPDGKGLDPGTCSWIDRVVSDNEPRQIQFAVTGSQLQSIPASLNNPDNFRSFFVFNTNKGYFEAKSHAVWKAGGSPSSSASGNSQSSGQASERITKPPKTTLGSVLLPKTKSDDERIVKPSYRAEDVRLSAISDLRVSATTNGAMFTFMARPGPVPVVEINKKAPFKDSLKRASFNPSLMSFNPVVMKNKSTPTGTAYAGGSYQTNTQLEQGTLYHYIITVTFAGSAPYQLTGSFKTLSRTVKVYITQIHILDDSDNDTSGDLFFRLGAEAGSSAGRSFGGDTDKLQWESGHTERFRNFFPLVIEKAGNRLRIWLEGTDDDSLTGCFIPPRGDGPLSFEYLRPHKKPHCDDEVNYAKGEFDLSKYPGKFVNIPFTLQSMPLGPSGVRLTFDVSGYIEFTNPDVP